MKILIGNDKIDLVIAKSFSKRFFGLMFKRKVVDYCMMFPNCRSVHTFFMFQNIDIVFTDKNDIITGIFLNIKPNRIICGKGKNAYEFKAFLARSFNIGDKIKKEP